MLSKLKWLRISFGGKKYFIKYTNKLKDDEILIKGHRIYVGDSSKRIGGV